MAGSGEPLRQLFQRAALRERALARRGLSLAPGEPRRPHPLEWEPASLEVMALGWRTWVCVDGWFAEINEPPRARGIESAPEPGAGRRAESAKRR
jgi:hypothetical protein